MSFRVQAIYKIPVLPSLFVKTWRLSSTMEVKHLESSLNGFLFRPGKLVDPGKVALLFIFQCQRQCAVAFQGNDNDGHYLLKRVIF